MLAWPLGAHLARVWTGEPRVAGLDLTAIDRAFFGRHRTRLADDYDGGRYALALVALNAAAFLGLYALMRLSDTSGAHGGPGHALPPDLALRTTIERLTDIGPRPPTRPAPAITEVSGLLVAVFVADGSGLACAAALARAFASAGSRRLGNFQADLLRNDLYVLAPVTLVTLAVLALVRLAGGPTAAGLTAPIIDLATNALRFGCAFAFGRVTRSAAQGRGLVALMAAAAALDALTPASLDSASSAESSVQRLAGVLAAALRAALGPGFASLLAIALLAAWIGGLLVGRTPEYLGKRLHAREIKLLALTLLASMAIVLAFSAGAALLPELRRAGLARNAGAAYDNTAAACAMVIGRFGVLIPILAIAGGLSAKPRRAPTAGTAS
jgi:K+-transporting ATPase ATPase A chain